MKYTIIFRLRQLSWAISRLFRSTKERLFANANEITVQDTLIIQKDGLTLSASSQIQRDLAGTGKFTNVQQVGGAELIVFPADLVAEGISHVWFKNLDAVDDVSLSLNVGITQVFALLKPGDTTHVAINKVPTVDPSIYASPSAGTVPLQIHASGT